MYGMLSKHKAIHTYTQITHTPTYIHHSTYALSFRLRIIDRERECESKKETEFIFYLNVVNHKYTLSPHSHSHAHTLTYILDTRYTTHIDTDTNTYT